MPLTCFSEVFLIKSFFYLLFLSLLSFTGCACSWVTPDYSLPDKAGELCVAQLWRIFVCEGRQLVRPNNKAIMQNIKNLEPKRSRFFYYLFQTVCFHDFIDEAIFECVLSRHPVVTFSVFVDFLYRLTRVFC